MQATYISTQSLNTKSEGLRYDIFVGFSDGTLSKFHANSFQSIKDYGKIHKGAINALGVSTKKDLLITTDRLGYMKHRQISADKGKFSMYGKVHVNGIIKVVMCELNDTFFTIDNANIMKQWQMGDGIHSSSCLNDLGVAIECYQGT